jgi:hypothetical protein
MAWEAAKKVCSDLWDHNVTRETRMEHQIHLFIYLFIYGATEV